MRPLIDLSQTELHTARLLLRPWQSSDLHDFYRYASVDGVGQPAGWLPHKSIEETENILRMYLERKNALALEQNGRVIGSISVESYDPSLFPEFQALSVAELGYQLSKSHWGKGMMPEAVSAVCTYLFAMEKFDLILCSHFNDNPQSARVLEKCGFQRYKPIELETHYGVIKPSYSWILRRPHP